MDRSPAVTNIGSGSASARAVLVIQPPRANIVITGWVSGFVAGSMVVVTLGFLSLEGLSDPVL